MCQLPKHPEAYTDALAGHTRVWPAQTLHYIDDFPGARRRGAALSTLVVVVALQLHGL